MLAEGLDFASESNARDKKWSFPFNVWLIIWANLKVTVGWLTDAKDIFKWKLRFLSVITSGMCLYSKQFNNLNHFCFKLCNCIYSCTISPYHLSKSWLYLTLPAIKSENVKRGPYDILLSVAERKKCLGIWKGVLSSNFSRINKPRSSSK